MQAASLVVMGIAVIGGLVAARNLSLTQIVNFSPRNPILGALFMILLYCIKSLSVFFPVIVLFLATGSMFPLPLAIAVTMTGLLAGSYVAYGVGELSSDKGALIVSRFPKLKRIMGDNPRGEKFMNFFLRINGLVPSDAVSMYFGAVRMSFWDFTWTTLAGHAPNALLVTMLGASIKEPGSWQFYVSLVLTVLLTIGSAVIYIVYEKKEGLHR